MRNLVIGLIALAVIAVGVWYFGFRDKSSSAPEAQRTVVEVGGAVVLVDADGKVRGEMDKPMRYMRRQRGDDYEIVPQAWVQGQSNCRTTQGSVVVCSAAWKGYADLVTVKKPACGVAKKAASSACTTVSGTTKREKKTGGATALPAGTTSGEPTTMVGGAR